MWLCDDASMLSSTGSCLQQGACPPERHQRHWPSVLVGGVWLGVGCGWGTTQVCSHVLGSVCRSACPPAKLSATGSACCNINHDMHNIHWPTHTPAELLQRLPSFQMQKNRTAVRNAQLFGQL